MRLFKWIDLGIQTLVLLGCAALTIVMGLSFGGIDYETLENASFLIALVLLPWQFISLLVHARTGHQRKPHRMYSWFLLSYTLLLLVHSLTRPNGLGNLSLAPMALVVIVYYYILSFRILRTAKV